jgi:dipicolinate synthase subunit A
MILVVANDARMTYIANELSEHFNVLIFEEGMNLRSIKYAILPFKVDPTEMKALVNQLPIDCTIFTPIKRDFLENIKNPVVVIMDHDEIAIYNSVPTAEGTIYYIMKHTEFTIHNANIHVIGAGRCGETLAKSLKNLGANVTVSTRNPNLVARLYESGIKTVDLDCLILREADVIVNTVPAMMLDKQKLEQVKKNVYIADIASAPGGVDFVAAEALKIKAHLLPALPGIVAPKTASAYLAGFIRRQLAEE